MSRSAVSLVIFLLSLSVPALSQTTPASNGPLTLIHATSLPEIVGDFDHFPLDARRNHLFVTAEEHHSVEMFDARTGEHLQSLPGFKTPHSIAYVPEKDELLVCDGGDSALIVVSASDFHRVDRIGLIDGSATGKGDSPDAAFYDVATRLYYIGNGGASANLPNSVISVYSVDTGKLLDRKFSVPGNNVESIGVDDAHHRLYVNIRDKQQVGVYGLDDQQMITTWTAPDMKGNTALLVDSRNQRIFVAGRKPGMFYVFDENGKVVSKINCADINDDLSFDPELHRVYLSGTQGISVIRQDGPDTYTEVLRLPTNGAKTSYLMPDRQTFFAVHPKNVIDAAGLLLYRINR